MTSPDGEGVPNNADEKEKGDDQKPFATVVVEMNLVFMLKKKCNQEKQKENGQVFHKIEYTRNSFAMRYFLFRHGRCGL